MDTTNGNPASPAPAPAAAPAPQGENYLTDVNLGLVLLQGALAAAKLSGASELVSELEGAVSKLEGVIGTPVTKSQLESLRG
jgi:hypothetical protein